MTFDQWRKVPENVGALREALEQPIIHEAFEIMAREGMNFVQTQSDATPHGAHICLGAIQGFRQWPMILQLLATHPTISRTIPATYGE